ncbi:MAG: dTDP-4-dehydrorhamnose 3,5-epimerase [Actinomycetota bacterium]
MKFTETELSDAFVIDIEPIGDERGFFARWYCSREFAEHGIAPPDAQGNLSYNRHTGTVRGMHMQRPPASEAKLVRCVHGAILDVIIDTRKGSPTRWQSVGYELSADNRRALYVPEGFAHGYQTLTDDAEVMYQVSQFYSPGNEVGLRHDDPELGLSWPLPITSVSDKDSSWPLLADIDREEFGEPA